ncbi:MAG TPA: hypothetical protein VFF26_10770 [Gallionella sp.]|nr:hypothetical protein [Gallionella sp.]
MAKRYSRVINHQEGIPIMGSLPRPSCRIRNCVRATLLAIVVTLAATASADEGEIRSYPIRLYEVASGRLLTTLEGHTGRVVTLAFSPDGRWLASSADYAREANQAAMSRDFGSVRYFMPDNGVRLWDVTTGREVGEVARVAGEPTQAIAFSADGRKLATGTQKDLRWWQVPSLQSLSQWDVKAGTLAVDPTGKLVATVATFPTKQIEIRDAVSGQLLHELRFPGKAQGVMVPSLAFNATGEKLIAILVGHNVQDIYTSGVFVWDAATGKPLGRIDEDMDTFTSSAVALLPDDRVVTPTQVAKLPRGPREKAWDHRAAQAVAADPQGRLLATVGKHQPIRILDLASGKLVREIDGPDVSAASMAFSPDGKLLAVGAAYPTMTAWSTTHLQTVIRDAGSIGYLGFSADGRQLTTSYWHPSRATASRGATLRRWTLAEGKAKTLHTTSEYQSVGELSPDGRLATLFTKDSVLLLDMQSGKTVQSFPGRGEKATFSPKGNFLAVGSDGGDVRIWDLRARRQVGEYTHRGPVGPLAWHPDDQMLVSGGRQPNALVAWDSGTREIVGHIKTTGEIRSIAWQPDGDGFATAEGGKVVWRGVDGETRAEVPLHSAAEEVSFHPSQPWLAVTRYRRGKQPTVLVVDMTTGQERYQLPDYTSPGQVAFSPDGRWLVTSNEADVRLYDATSGRLAAIVDPHDVDARLAFSPEGTKLATGGREGMLRVWSLADRP